MRGVWFVLTTVAFHTALFGQQSVHYELTFPNAVHHEAEIRATFSGVKGPTLEAVMSRSSPGRYALHEFAKNVYRVRAVDSAGHALQMERPNDHQWNVLDCSGAVTISYTLYGDRVDGTYAAIDETHAHLNMPAALLWAHGFEGAPASLKFTVPPGSGWEAATQLMPSADGMWTAPSLEWLMDSPIELSRHELREWKVDDSIFRLALHDRGTKEDADKYAHMCESIVREEAAVFGGFPKYDAGTYTFLVDYLPFAKGDGMEHRDSTVISSSLDLSSSASQLIHTVSHEFFHAWNVKRIRPRSLEPFNFEDTDMSGELWFAEGFTNYYGPLILQRAGITDMDEYLRSMSGAVDAVLNSPGRNVYNVVDMSRQAPFVDAATSIDANNFANTFISYYTYGQALALGLDLAIREQFEGKSLDDWMRTMWRAHPDSTSPYSLKELQDALAEATSAEFADEFFTQHVYGTNPMDYKTLLAPAGLLLERAHPGHASVGPEKLSFTDSGVEIATNAQIGSPFYRAGLDRADKILAWNGKSFKNSGELQYWLNSRRPNEQIKIKAETRTGTKEVRLELTEDCTWRIAPSEASGGALSAQIVQFRSQWLGPKALQMRTKNVKEP